jgi:hypothetical protein
MLPRISVLSRMASCLFFIAQDSRASLESQTQNRPTAFQQPGGRFLMI